MIRFAFHLLAAALYSFTIWYDFHHIDLGPNIGWDAYGGKLRFLTFINLCVHALFYIFCTVFDILQGLPLLSPKKLRTLRNAKDHMFTVLVFPVGTFVALMFWGIYTFDRELIFPQFLDNLFPAWANHVMHTAILPIALIEMSLEYHNHPRPRWSGLKNLVIFSLGYQAWTLWVYYHTSQWIYPIFNALNGWQKVAFMQFGTVCILICYFIGESLQPMLCPPGKTAAAAPPSNVRKPVGAKNASSSPKKKV